MLTETFGAENIILIRWVKMRTKQKNTQGSNIKKIMYVTK